VELELAGTVDGYLISWPEMERISSTIPPWLRRIGVWDWDDD
jgi:hypothetical protein